ncbi:DUF4276 family protein [Pseudomonas sp. MWU12-2029]|uniref:DUF4276 family protein n=1 Tax=Pseudomonas sp. MWU12-2029 TaxID=2927805 RepID=UPI00200C7158|nr:DUF4276 family protein [Pseudomonas sp. MWU12-2029]
MPVFIVGEDQLCAELAQAIVLQSGKAVEIQSALVANGCAPFKTMIEKMNNVARNVMPVFMLADADQAPCVVTQRNQWMPANPAQNFSLRLAVREAEAWILADHEGLSEFAGFSAALMDRAPDELNDPKQELLRLIRRSKRRDLREEMLPKKGAKNLVGLGYNLHLTRFVREHWSADRASQRSPSLARSIPRVLALL